MPERNLVALIDNDGTSAVVAPELGGWLLRYARKLPKHGEVEALHFSQPVVDRYPREMHAGIPVLFPLVSNNRVGEHEHHYEWSGNLYEMPQHGFARRSKWSVREQTAASVTMELTDSETTRANYPFAFRFCLTYRVNQGRLHWEQVVENRAAEALPFSTGFHPYFAVPLTAKSQRAVCFVEIPEAKRLMPVGKFERFTAGPFPGQNWSVDEDVAGTMFLTDLKKQELILIDPVSELEVVFNFEDAPQHRFVAIWAKTNNEPFYCLEPWTALPNSFARQSKDHELILLEPQKTFRAAMWIELRPMA
jgi:galactose mutarotase-like enzyme